MLTTTLELAAGGGVGTDIAVVPAGAGAIVVLLTTSLFGGKIVGVGIASVGFPVSSSSGTSGTSGERVKSGVPRLRWIVFVLGGRVVVVVPESVSVSLLVGRTGGMGTGYEVGMVIGYVEMYVDPTTHFVTVGAQDVTVYSFLV